MTDMSDQFVFHMTPREVYDLFSAGRDCGYHEGRFGTKFLSLKGRLIDIMFVHAMHIRHEAGDAVYDRDELRRAIEAVFEGLE